MSKGEESAFPFVEPKDSSRIRYNGERVWRELVREETSHGGLTKRELIAAMILQGLSSNPWLMQTSIEAAEHGVRFASLHSMAIDSADALMAALNKAEGK
jgi:hypothetical protein